MKKYVIAAFCILLLLAAGCGQEKKQQPSLYDKGLEVAEALSQELNEDYVSYFSAGDEIIAFTKELAGQDYSNPQSVYQLQLSWSESRLMELILGVSAGTDDEIPEQVQKRLNNLSYIVNIINARKGTAYLALSSILTADELFVNDTITENTAYVYFYENAYPVFVSYQVGEDGAIHAVGGYIFSDELKEQGAGVLKEMLGQDAYEDFSTVVQITQIK